MFRDVLPKLNDEDSVRFKGRYSWFCKRLEEIAGDMGLRIIEITPGTVYDLGGGTFDVSIAESIGGKVNLLAQEGKEMCGGRDWDRRIFDSIAAPWLRENFALPDFLG